MSESLPSVEGPPRRRESWSIRRIAEEIGGRPIADFQGSAGSSALAPYRPAVTETLPPRAHPRGPAASTLSSSARTLEPEGSDHEVVEELDPVDRVNPPLTRSTGRALHGHDQEHHLATLETVRSAPTPPEPGSRPHRPGPSTRPERIYLHYLLLHLDRLSDHALRYLESAVREEVDARKGPSTGDTPPR